MPPLPTLTKKRRISRKRRGRKFPQHVPGAEPNDLERRQAPDLRSPGAAGGNAARARAQRDTGQAELRIRALRLRLRRRQDEGHAARRTAGRYRAGERGRVQEASRASYFAGQGTAVAQLGTQSGQAAGQGWKTTAHRERQRG